MTRLNFFRAALWAALVATAGMSYGQNQDYYNLVAPAQPSPLTAVGYMQDDAATMSPSDEAVVGGGCDACAPACDTCGPVCGCGSCCDPCTPWEIPTPSVLACNGLEIGGWLSAGVYGNQFGAASNGPVAFRDNAGGSLDQLWFYVDKTAEATPCSYDWGFHMDFLFGADAPDTQTFGTNGVGAGAWDNEWISSNDGVYGFAMPQLYGELAMGDLSVKFGHFYTIIGYEVVGAPDNFFYSHATTMYYAEPFTHVGALGTYDAGDVTFYGGWVNGWDQGWLNPTGASQFMGGASVSLCDDISFTYALVAGNSGEANGSGDGDVFMNSFVLDVALTDNLSYVFQHDLGTMNSWANGAGTVPTSSQWYGINQYLFYTINDCWQAGARVEWFCDDDGQRVGYGAANYASATFGLNWKPTANVTLRPELRWDGANSLAGNNPLPFDNDTKSYQFSGGFDFIMTF